jgi:hypothetical protein
MRSTFASVEDALLTLSNPEDPQWAAAFSFLASHPDTAELILETFRDTLEEMGAEAGRVDPLTGEPVYSLADVARALGIPESALENAFSEARDQGSEDPPPGLG